jgi:hypothetical protein
MRVRCAFVVLTMLMFRGLPARAGADPWQTSGTTSMTAAPATTVDARMPTSGGKRRFEGDAQAAGLDIHLCGRWLAFDLSMLGAYDEKFAGPVGESGTTFTAGEARAGFSGVIWNSNGVFFAVGPSIEGRATALGSLDQGNEGAASWQAVFAGPEVRGRVFAGPRLYVSANVFAGVESLGGGWQAARAKDAITGVEVIHSGSLESGDVIAGSASIAARPVGWLALSGGAAWRSAVYRFERGETGSEQSLRPFLGLELLY